MTASHAPETRSRISALDGLRGIAAVSVVFGHARLIVAGSAGTAFLLVPPLSYLVGFSAVWGAHAVWLFFILSGLVLCRQALRADRFDYGRFLLSRFARLYIPVWAAIAFTVVTMVFVSRNVRGLGAWVDSHPPTYSLSAVLRDAFLIDGTSGNLSPLWTLQPELLFSLLLVVFVAAARHCPWWLLLAAATGLSVAGAILGITWLTYLPMFGLGAALARGWSTFERWTTWLRATWPRWLRTIGVTAGVLAALASQTIAVFTSSAPTAIDVGVTLLGLCGIILLAGFARPVARTLNTRPLRWTGRVSFSLYLIHEPILLAFAYATHGAGKAVVLGVVLSFVAAAGFYTVVEKPAHRLARWISARGADRTAMDPLRTRTSAPARRPR